MTNHPQKERGLAHVTHFIYATVDLEKLHYGTPLAEINNVSRTLDGRRYTRLKASICHCICCKLGSIIYQQQIDQVEFEHYCSNMC